MNQELAQKSPPVPILFAPNKSAARRFIEFFTANIRNLNTRRAYFRNANQFGLWCEENGLNQLHYIEPVHVAAYIETLQTQLSPSSVKQHLAAIRVLFDWLVVGQVVASNPASVVRGPKHSVKKGKTPVLDAEEARELLDSIPTDTLIGLRDKALIAMMVYSFARVGAVLKMHVEDVYVQGRKTWIRLHEKGGKRHDMPCHHSLDAYLHAYIDTAGLADDPKGYLFRTSPGHSDHLTDNPMTQSAMFAMVRRRAAEAGIATLINNHTFRATGITTYLKNGGKLEVAQQMANHESSRTTGLYDRRDDELTLDEVERILI